MTNPIQQSSKPMQKNIIIGAITLILSIVLSGNVFAQEEHASTLIQQSYLGQTPPDTIPIIFAPNLISLPDRYEFGSVFSKDGTEFYFGVDTNFSQQVAGRLEIWFTELKDGVWSAPKVLLTHPTFTHNDPMLSPDESRLYFISNRPITGDQPKDIDLWYVERTQEGWSEPQNIGPPVNSSVNEFYASFTDEGALYFSSNTNDRERGRRGFDIYKAEWSNNSFEKPQKLPETVNSNYYEGDVYVAPDESYLIFCAARRGGYGQGDLYISFKDEHGNWTQSKNMGSSINNDKHQFCPFVSYDGKYLFYTSDREVYWVSMEILERFR
ncbi:MAG: hypothetical protein AAFN93_02915 [Bacteroidota bacterium]